MYRELGYGHWLSDKIEDNEVFPVGGYMPGCISDYMRVDAEIFQPFFQKVAQNKKVIEENKAFHGWFEKRKTGLDYELFCHIYAFDVVIRNVFPNATRNASKRIGFYEGKGKRNLSEGMARGYAACNEFSVLAQLYFQNQNIPTRYVGGELVHNGDFDAAEPHSFIVFQNKGKEYVYDPVNQLERNLPRIAEFVGNKENDYLETKNLLNGDKWYYAGGHKGAFLKNLPTKSTLKQTLEDRRKCAMELADKIRRMPNV